MMRRAWVVFVLAFAIAGCAAAQDTLAQQLAWERAEKCKGGVANIQITRVEPDGKIWYQHSSGGSSAFNDCLKQAALEQAQRRVAPAPPAAVASAVTPTSGGSNREAEAAAAILMPTWKVGDEWAYRTESPDSVSTFVWSVDEMAKVGGVEHYVVKTGTRQIYYRAADGAITQQKISGDVTNRYTPAWLLD